MNDINIFSISMILHSKWHGEVLYIDKHQGQDGSTVLGCGAGVWCKFYNPRRKNQRLALVLFLTSWILRGDVKSCRLLLEN